MNSPPTRGTSRGMQAVGILLLVLVLSLLSTAHSALPENPSACPIENEGETTADCPWASIARELEATLASSRDSKNLRLKVAANLDSLASGLMRKIAKEGKLAGTTKNLWGLSINYDEGAKKTILAEPIIDVLLERASVAPRGEGIEGALAERVVHAGIEHTYGYLLSNLKTPYGYKRQRWVRPDIEFGFGLRPGVLSPTPDRGGFFANVTHFAGRIAFRENNDQDARAIKLLKQKFGTAPSIRNFDYASLRGRRITETVVIEGSAALPRTVEIRTDFVPFPKSGPSPDGNAELLVYSVRDSERDLPYLITAFPIAAGFSEAAVDPKNLGSQKTVFTRYNAFVPGVTDARSPLIGKREVSTF